MRRTAASALAQAWIVAIFALLSLTASGQGATLRIVAIGASNTSGWGVGEANAYPAQLQALLRGKGIDARVTNAGVPFDTTNAMLRRLDDAVPDGTHIVILQPGANDLRFFGTSERRAANIAAMVSRLQARRIKVVVYDEVVPRQHYAWDGIHFTREGHTAIAAFLLPRILRVVGAGGDRRSSAQPD